MTGSPLAGPASAYPTLSTPASICLIAPNDVFVPGLIAGTFASAARRIDHAKLSGGDRHRGASNKAAPILIDLVDASERIHLDSLQLDRCGSAERESERFHARIEKLDFESPVSDGTGLPDQLIQPLLGDGAVALLVDIEAVSRAGRLRLDHDAKAHRRARRCRSHHEMNIARVETIRDASVRLVQRGVSALHRPVAGQRPLIEGQPRGQLHTSAACREAAPPGDKISRVCA